MQGIKEKQIQIEELEKINLVFEENAEILNLQIVNSEDSLEELSKFDKIFEKIKREFEDALKEEIGRASCRERV